MSGYAPIERATAPELGAWIARLARVVDFCREQAERTIGDLCGWWLALRRRLVRLAAALRRELRWRAGA